MLIIIAGCLAVWLLQACHPQNIALLKTRGDALGIETVVGDITSADFGAREYFGAIVQYPNTYGEVFDWSAIIQAAHSKDMLVVACTDLLASAALKPVGEMGADVAVGSAQRFGVPMVRHHNTRRGPVTD